MSNSPTPQITIRCQNCHGCSADWLQGQHGVQWTVRDIQETDAGAFLCAICRQYPGQPIKAGPYQPKTQIPHRIAA